MASQDLPTQAAQRLTSVRIKACCLLVWLALAASVVLLVVQERSGTLHPVCVPFLLLVALAIAAALLGDVFIARELWRSRGRGKRLWLWALAIALPFVLFAVPSLQARRGWDDFQVPHGWSGRLVVLASAGLMEGQAAYFYPRHVETDRIVMFYHDLDNPQLDADTMDRHSAELEAKVGAPLRSKIHWVRGSLLGEKNLSYFGLALGSTSSPRDWTGPEGYLDRHELAHAVIVQQRPVSADPPMVLHEGWADAQSGLTTRELAARALQERKSQPELRMSDLFGPDWYHQDSGAVYSYGGAFVDFLLRRFGTATFVDLYNRCQPNTFEAQFQAIYGQPLRELEAAFWEDANAHEL